MVSISFHSPHLERRRGSQLIFGIERDNRRRNRRETDSVTFDVPADFHVHNDSVAAALLTLVGQGPWAIDFNFPISSFCAEMLREYYGLAEIGPIDPDLEPRRPGRYVALNFSGGLDSSALRCLLEHVMPGEFKVVSSDFGGVWYYERGSHGDWPADLICRTDFRRRGYRGGRFMGAVPLLFADYLDLYGITSGHVFSQAAEALESNPDGHEPAFVRKAMTYRAGGLEELQIIRGVEEVGVGRILMRLAPQRVEAALRGSSLQHTTRNQARGLAFRILYEMEGRPLPDAVRAYDLEPKPYLGDVVFAGGAPALFAIKHRGDAAIRALSGPDYDFRIFDFSFLDALSMDYLVKYNTNFVELVPEQIRAPLLTLLASIDIEPFTERDWREMDAARAGVIPMLVQLGVIPTLPDAGG